jgi:hypothetical protein
LTGLSLSTLAPEVPLRTLLHPQSISFRKLFVGFFVSSRDFMGCGQPVVGGEIASYFPVREDVVQRSW